MEFHGQAALITGGGGGIGRAAARRLLQEGANVVLNRRRGEVLDAARAELDRNGERVAVVAGDASRPETAERLVATAVERFGGLDVLVNSTGIFRPTPFLEQTEEHVEEALDSILRPTFYVAQAAARDGEARCRRQPQRRLDVGDRGDHRQGDERLLGRPGRPAYVRFMTPNQAREVLDSVNGFHPLGRHGYPEDVVEAILFLAGERAGWITGTTLPIDGGVLAGRNAPAEPAVVEAAAA